MQLYKKISKEKQESIKKVRCVIFDFDGVFTNNKVYVDQNGIETVVCSRSDSMGIKLLQDIGIDTFILSSEVNQVVRIRAEKLRMECYHGIDNKLAKLNEILKSKNINPHEVLYVGNDINDSDCLKAVGFPVVVKDSHPYVLKLGMYVTNSYGGNGAVREVCDLVHFYHN